MHGEVLREIVGVDFGQARPADDAGVVDQDVDAPELLDRGVDERLRAGRRGDVVRVGDRDAAGGDDLGGDGRPPVRRRRRRPAIEPPRSLTTTRAPRVGEQERVGPADPAPRAGDDRDAPSKLCSLTANPSCRVCTDQSL